MSNDQPNDEHEAEKANGGETGGAPAGEAGVPITPPISLLPVVKQTIIPTLTSAGNPTTATRTAVFMTAGAAAPEAGGPVVAAVAVRPVAINTIIPTLTSAGNPTTATRTAVFERVRTAGKGEKEEEPSLEDGATLVPIYLLPVVIPTIVPTISSTQTATVTLQTAVFEKARTNPRGE